MAGMITLFRVVAVLGFVSLMMPVTAQAKDDSQAELAEQAWTAYHPLEQELTDLYQKTLIGLPTADAREKFTNAQNAWMKYRDLQGEFAAGATESKYLRALSFTETTKARIAELKAWVASQEKK